MIRNVDGLWTQPVVPHPDNWHFEGCPVNGPHLDVEGQRSALIWFSAPQGQPAVKIAFSNNAGLNFGPPVRIDEGNATGRAQVALLPAGQSAIAFWLENQSGTSRLLGRLIRQNGAVEKPFEVAPSGVKIGYPHVARSGLRIFITWCDEERLSQIHVAVLDSDEK